MSSSLQRDSAENKYMYSSKEQEALYLARNSSSLLTLLVLNFLLHIFDSIARLHLKGDSLARKGLHKDLHLAPAAQYACERPSSIEMSARGPASNMQTTHLVKQDRTRWKRGQSARAVVLSFLRHSSHLASPRTPNPLEHCGQKIQYRAAPVQVGAVVRTFKCVIVLCG